jgi:glycosyltransferase involved in cell wall biosynthesis
MRNAVSVVTAMYNDSQTALDAIQSLEKHLTRHFTAWEIVIVDDASSDGSPELVRRYIRNNPRIQLCIHQKNQGIAKTYRELYRRAKWDVIVLFSLDGEWEASDTILLAKTLIEHNVDIVIGVRRHKQYSIGRAVISRLYNMLTVSVFGVPTKDAGSIKAMRKHVVSSVPIISRGVFDEAERIIRASLMGYRIRFVDVHHRVTHKVHRGIGMQHVLEALRDAVRVFLDTRGIA